MTALLLTCLVTCLAPPPAAAAAVPLPVVAVLPGVGQSSVVVDLGIGPRRATPDDVIVTFAGTAQPARMTPVLSDRLTAALIVDASEAGAAALPGWLSAATRFVLEEPAGAQAAVVADTAPPAVIIPPHRGAADVIQALSTVRAHGRRSTSDALTLALGQLPPTPAGPRLVVLYTTAPDAGGEPAAALAARMAGAGAMLVVVGPAGSSGFWSGAGRSTGGFFAPTGVSIIPALDQVTTTLRGRYLVTFPTPALLPALLSVSVRDDDVTLTGNVVVPPPAPVAASRPGSGIPHRIAWMLGVCLLAVVVIAALLLRRRAAARAVAQHPQESAPVAARGRAAVPGPASGRGEDRNLLPRQQPPATGGRRPAGRGEDRNGGRGLPS
jgi:hypothetical protein